MCRAYTFKHGIVPSGRNVIEACVSFSDNRFPNQNLSGISVCDTVASLSFCDFQLVEIPPR
ncbi:hypothetical protein EVA_02215 [gut metagenome]|uniref:Uncharacterized protein n=1 Tax=gut metagenome TaxID=749906 RepID=J9H1N6_9ZZZZ